jgi:hypothetical protein
LAKYTWSAFSPYLVSRSQWVAWKLRERNKKKLQIIAIAAWVFFRSFRMAKKIALKIKISG